MRFLANGSAEGMQTKTGKRFATLVELLNIGSRCTRDTL